MSAKHSVTSLADQICDYNQFEQNFGSYEMSYAAEVVQRARDAFDSGVTKSIKFREKQLKALKDMLEDNTSEFQKALAADLRKSKQEAVLSEIGYTIGDIDFMLQNLR